MQVAKMIIELMEKGQVFSDLQIKAGSPLLYRAPQGYQPHSDYLLTAEDVGEFAAFADSKWQEKIGSGQFDVSATLKGHTRLRCNFYRYGPDNAVGVVARMHPLVVPDVMSLGIPSKLRHLVNMRPKGLIIVTGPFGSGKTTTIASLLDYVNASSSSSIVTLEDPVEYIIESKRSVVTQREIPTNVSSFSDGLKGAKRQRPDLIMVGEMRDRDTIEAGVMAADSGCLVIASTHGRNAAEAVETLLSYFEGGEQNQKLNMLANSIVAIISQILLPSKDGKKFVLAYEMFVNNPSAAKLIRENRMVQLKTNMETSSADGSVLLNTILAGLVADEQIAREEAIRASYDKESLIPALPGTHAPARRI